MEVAIKMALRLWDVRVRTGKIRNQTAIGDSEEAGDHMKNVIVLTQRDCYHGASILISFTFIPFNSIPKYLFPLFVSTQIICFDFFFSALFLLCLFLPPFVNFIIFHFILLFRSQRSIFYLMMIFSISQDAQFFRSFR